MNRILLSIQDAHHNVSRSLDYTKYNETFHEFIACSASSKKNATRLSTINYPYFTIVQMKEAVRQIVAKLFSIDNIIYENSRGMTYNEKIHSAKSSYCIFHDGNSSMKGTIQFEVFLLLDNICHPSDFQTLLSVIHGSYKGDHIASSISHNICHTQIWSKVVLQSINRFILFLIGLMKDKKIIQNAVMDFFIEDGLKLEVDLLRWKINHCCSQYAFYIAMYFIKKIGLYPVIEGLAWHLESNDEQTSEQLGKFNIFPLLLSLLNKKEEIIDGGTIPAPKALLIQQVINPFMIRLIMDYVGVEGTNQFPLCFKEFVRFGCCVDIQHFFDDLCALHSIGIHSFWLPLMHGSDYRKRKREAMVKNGDCSMDETRGTAQITDTTLENNSTSSQEDSHPSDTDLSSVKEPNENVSAIIGEQEKKIQEESIQIADSLPEKTDAAVIADAKLYDIPSWNECLRSFNIIRRYIEGHNMKSMLKSVDALLDTVTAAGSELKNTATVGTAGPVQNPVPARMMLPPTKSVLKNDTICKVPKAATDAKFLKEIPAPLLTKMTVAAAKQSHAVEIVPVPEANFNDFPESYAVPPVFLKPVTGDQVQNGTSTAPSNSEAVAPVAPIAIIKPPCVEAPIALPPIAALANGNLEFKASPKLAAIKSLGKEETGKIILVYPFVGGEQIEELARKMKIFSRFIQGDGMKEPILSLEKILKIQQEVSSGSRHILTITDEDRFRLQPRKYLNDTLIDFWMKW